MSNSKRDQKGPRINGEIWGKGCVKVFAGKVYPVCSGEPVGGPDQKKDAKKQATRSRRREGKTEITTS